MASRLYYSLIATAFVALASPTAARTVPALAASHTVAQRHGGWMARDANARHPWLYVSGINNNVVDIYDLAKFAVPQIGEITKGLNHPGGISLDRAGNLYVANQGGGTVTIYAPGQTFPSLTLAQGLTEPVDSAIDANGDVYVSNRATTPSIVVYPQGQTVPSATITSSLIQIPTAVIFDATGNLYFADNNTGVSEMVAGTQQLVSLGLQQDLPASGLALDPLTGDLFVSGPGITQVYAPGKVDPLRHMGFSPDYLAVGVVHGVEYIFGGLTGDDVAIYRHNRNRQYAVFASGAQYVVGSAFKPADVP
jgi:DNA-binding beta-propeller fold protein YncE